MHCSVIAAAISCGVGLLVVFETEGMAQLCGSITRAGEVVFAQVEANISSLNGDDTVGAGKQFAA